MDHKLRRIAPLLAVAAVGAAMAAYRAGFVEPRYWGALCTAPGAPAVCLPRQALVWLQREYLWGGAALALGLAAFIRGGPLPLAAAAVAAGICAVENYNATGGMAGAALGLWVWLECDARRGRNEYGAR